MHPAAYDYVAAQVAARDPFPHVVEFGSLNINGTVRALFDGEYVGVDRVDGPGVDVVADAATYTRPRKADCVVCCEVLEHHRHPKRLIDNAHRLLRKGGVLILTAACDPRQPHSAVDGGPLLDGEFYRNVNPATLRRWLTLFTESEVDVSGEDVRAVAVK